MRYQVVGRHTRRGGHKWGIPGVFYVVDTQHPKYHPLRTTKACRVWESAPVDFQHTGPTSAYAYQRELAEKEAKRWNALAKYSEDVMGVEVKLP